VSIGSQVRNLCITTASIPLLIGVTACENGDRSGGGGGDLDCADIGHEVRIRGSDPHGLDRDGDGIGCEGW
jgi:hypothetical protein